MESKCFSTSLLFASEFLVAGRLQNVREIPHKLLKRIATGRSSVTGS